MFVQFSQDVGAWPKGSIQDLEDDIGQSFVDLKRAVPSSAGAYLQASRQADQATLKAEILSSVEETVRNAMGGRTVGQPAPKKPAPPNGGGGVEFSGDGASIRHVSSPIDRNNSFGDMLGCIATMSQVDAPPVLREACRRRLEHKYATDVCTYDVDKEGNITSTTTRSMANGGMETITRTGTESMGGGQTYGFAVKPEWTDRVFEIASEGQVFVPSTFGVPVGDALEFKMPALNQYSAPTVVNGVPQAAVFAGFVCAYAGEITPLTSSDGQLNEIDFKIVDLTGFTSLSKDLLADGFIRMDAVATRVFGRAFAWVEDWMSIQGAGNGKPQGFLNSAALISGGGASGGATRVTANKILYDDLAWMQSHFAAMCWGGGRWIAHLSTIPQISAIKDAAGLYVFQPNALITQAMRQTATPQGDPLERQEMLARPMGQLLGWPLYFSEKVPQLGTTGDISLVCPDQYGWARRQGLEIGVSEHFYFSTRKIAYRFVARHDGKSLWKGPYIDASNTATPSSGWKSSPFVTLHSNP